MEMLNGKSIKRICVIPYSHHDYAWVCERSWHIARYIKCFTEVIEMLRENPDLTWHIDNVTHSWLVFEKECPSLAKEFAALVRDGRISVLNGGYSLARPSIVGEESYIRNLMLGRRYFQDTFGLNDIPSLFNADTACGHSQLPQIARLSGHRYYRFQRPDAMLTRRGVPFEFIWRGLDGSEVLVARGSYCNLYDRNDFLNGDYETEWEQIKKAFCDIWLSDKVSEQFDMEDLILFLSVDDGRPLRDINDKPLRMDEFMAEWNRREPVKMEYARFDDVLAGLEKQQLPVWDGVLDHSELTWQFPFKGDRSVWRLRFGLDKLLVKLEKTCAIAASLGMPYPKQKIQEYWNALFEITGHAIEYVLKQSVEPLMVLANGAYFGALDALRSAEEYIAHAVLRTEEIQGVAVNTLNWDVVRPVRLEVTSFNGVSGFDIVDGQGRRLDYQIIDYCSDNNKSEDGSDYSSVDVLVDATVPAMGYISLAAIPNGQSLKPRVEQEFVDTLPAAPQQPCEDKVEWDNGRLRVVFYKGHILSLENLVSGQKIQPNSGDVVASLMFSSFTPGQSWLSTYEVTGTYAFSPTSWRILQKGPIRFTYQARGTVAGNPATVTYTIDRNSPGVDIAVETDFRDEIEGMLTWRVTADAETEVYADIPFGAEKREFFWELFYDKDTGERLTPAPAEVDFPGQIYGLNWCSFASGGTPVSIVSQDCSVFYLFEPEKCAMSLILNRHMPLKYRTERWSGKLPDSVNGTGKNSFHFSLMLNKKPGFFTDIQRYHKERVFPLSARLKFGVGGRAGAYASLLRTQEPNIICTAAYMEGEYLYARFFECEGRRGWVDVALPASAKDVLAVDFEDNPVEIPLEFDLQNHSAKVLFHPYKIVTLKISLAPET